jgi:hypothetical protein
MEAKMASWFENSAKQLLRRYPRELPLPEN